MLSDTVKQAELQRCRDLTSQPPHYCSDCPSVGCSECDTSLFNTFASSCLHDVAGLTMMFFIPVQDYGFVKIPHCEVGASPSSVTRGRDRTGHNTDCQHLWQTGGFCCDTLWESWVGVFGLSNSTQMPRNIVNTLLWFLSNDLSYFFLFSPSILLCVAASKSHRKKHLRGRRSLAEVEGSSDGHVSQQLPSSCFAKHIIVFNLHFV